AVASPPDGAGERDAVAAGRRAPRRSRLADRAAPPARSPEPRAPAGVRAADHRPARLVAGGRDLGGLARSLRRARADGAAPARTGPARARAAAPHGRDRARVPPRKGA